MEVNPQTTNSEPLTLQTIVNETNMTWYLPELSPSGDWDDQTPQKNSGTSHPAIHLLGINYASTVIPG